ncbi:MAG: hypothetical protein RDV41_00345 [Planctomycetota bacterium]|nr:hypothetical protein [Planctomycetota bacterium]
MKRALRVSAMAAVFLVVASAIQADIIHLESGGKVEGVLVDKGTHYEVQTTTGTCTLQKDQVLLVEVKESVIEKYNKAAVEVKADDAEGHFALAMLCKEGKWNGKMRDELQKVIAINPDHEQARKELGYEMYEGKWLPRDEVMKARGYQLFEGKWVSPDFMRKIDDWKKAVRTVKSHEDKLNKALVKMSAANEALREKALKEFVVAAQAAGVTNADEVGGQFKEYYDDSWRVIAEVEKNRALTEIRATDARLININGITTFVGVGGGVPVTRRIELPQMNLVSIKTTALVPAQVQIRLWYPDRPAFMEE